MSRWPKDNPKDLARFYGDPDKGEPGKQLVSVVPPFRMTYDGKPIKAVSFHKKAAPALLDALEEIWEAYGRDQKAIDRAGISRYAGTYNPRKVRGSDTRWSNHAYGAAIDINAEQNGLGTKGNMPTVVVMAFKRQGAKWGGDYKGRKDPMHFEFVDNGEPDLPKKTAPKPEPKPVTPPHIDRHDDPPPEPDLAPPEIRPQPVPEPTPTVPVVPWYKRAWTYVAGVLFGGGMTVGGITLDANTLLALTLLLVVLGIGGLFYLRGKKKGWF